MSVGTFSLSVVFTTSAAFFVAAAMIAIPKIASTNICTLNNRTKQILSFAACCFFLALGDFLEAYAKYYELAENDHLERVLHKLSVASYTVGFVLYGTMALFMASNWIEIFRDQLSCSFFDWAPCIKHPRALIVAGKIIIFSSLVVSIFLEVIGYVLFGELVAMVAAIVSVMFVITVSRWITYSLTTELSSTISDEIALINEEKKHLCTSIPLLLITLILIVIDASFTKASLFLQILTAIFFNTSLLIPLLSFQHYLLMDRSDIGRDYRLQARSREADASKRSSTKIANPRQSFLTFSRATDRGKNYKVAPGTATTTT